MQGVPLTTGLPAPAFRQIGVIEGFYGRPWSHEDRLDILRFMQLVGMNTYYYAPKADPYHRARWREPYPPEAKARLQQLVDTAQTLGIAFYYSISPGLSIVYSDSSDWAVLREKIASVQRLGVGHFALMLDDVPATLTHPADRAAFETLADAHAHLINRLSKFLVTHGADLVVTPTTYTNAWGDRDYLRRLGAAVPSSIPFFWTGPDVASPTITADDARAWAELIGRQPLIWDNYPVNDYARWRLFLGPLRGRSADLASAAIGIISNPMNQAHASMLPLATVAFYARNPGGYEPEAAMQRATELLYGVELSGQLEPFLDLYGNYGWDLNVFEPLYAPGFPIDVRAIQQHLDRLEAGLDASGERPAASPGSAAALVTEIRPIVTATRRRLEQLRRDTTYEERGGLLTYRAALDQNAPARRSSMTVDGNLSDWDGIPWLRLRGPDGPDGIARIAFAWAGAQLFVAFRVRDGSLRAASGAQTGEADHIALVIDHDPGNPATHINEKDAVILLPAPDTGGEPEPVVVALDFHGFMAKNIAARRDLRFSEFLVTSLGGASSVDVARLRGGLRYAAGMTPTGYEAEIAVPRMNLDPLRVTIVVTDVGRSGRRYRWLPMRNYPGNPATFAEIVLER
jgi:hypothetical protein